MGSNLVETELCVIIVIGFVVLFIITKMGYWITPKISKEKFQAIILIILVIIAIKLILNVFVN